LLNIFCKNIIINDLKGDFFIKKTTLFLSALFITVTASLGKIAQAVLIDADRLNNLKPTTPDDCTNAILPQEMWIFIPKQRAPA
jgi:hypothetical protein